MFGVTVLPSGPRYDEFTLTFSVFLYSKEVLICQGSADKLNRQCTQLFTMEPIPVAATTKKKAALGADSCRRAEERKGCVARAVREGVLNLCLLL